ncbi:MAG: HNH endonuclease [Gammaproteobacteria bacterium]|nr:HNH endonuclease [Gammaproteobacteria bacterium]
MHANKERQSSPKRKPWTKEETIIVLNHYFKYPVSSAGTTNPNVINTAKLIGRLPNAVKMKIGNFASLDPELKKRGIGGLGNHTRLDEEVWNEFAANRKKLAVTSERLISKISNMPIEEIAEKNKDYKLDYLTKGEDKISTVKIRLYQKNFRECILGLYNNKCCITGLHIPSLLIASHIVPWSIDLKNRLNPENGICLNRLHDGAFDKGLITITPDYKIKLSKSLIYELRDGDPHGFFLPYQNQAINLPERYFPKKKFLEYHNKEIFTDGIEN